MSRMTIRTLMAVIVTPAIALAVIRQAGHPFFVMVVALVLWMIGERIMKRRRTAQCSVTAKFWGRQSS